MTVRRHPPIDVTKPDDHGHSRWLTGWNRTMFKVFGPAQLGDLSKPLRVVDPDPLCSRCESPESAHVNHRMADGKMLSRCPARPAR
jgi:hypothetical protein